ncbi:MAG: class I SAM-dependent methyltransferase [Sporichthyaceae bacterium]
MSPQRIPGLDKVLPPHTRRREVVRNVVPSGARKVLRKALRRFAPPPPPKPAKKAAAKKAAPPKPPAPKPAPIGKVIDFRRGAMEGWVTLPEGVESMPVVLRLGDVEAMRTVATPSPHAAEGDRQGVFRFQTRGLWEFAQAADKVTFVVDGKPLPIAGHGKAANPIKVGERTPADLAKLLADGHVFSRWGDLQVVKSQDTQWIDAVLDLYDTVANLLRDEFGYEGFVIYGSLLGTIREGGVIGVDNDADMAFVSKHSKGPALAAEMAQIAARLIELGLRATVVSTNLYVYDAVREDARIDLFHLYWDSKGVLAFPFGVAGTRDVTRSQWQGTTSAPFCHRTVGVPVLAEEVVAAIYGEGWRTPNPGFNWKKDKRTAGHAGRIPPEIWGPANWEDHYARIELADPSSFAASLLNRSDLPARVLDLGTGCGRDAVAFAGAGHSVLGLDRSARAVARARARVPGARFEVADLADSAGWVPLVREWIEAGEGPVLFHARFLFHALSEQEQEATLAGLAELARPGDLLAAEFRTTDDEKLPKNSAKMFRRFLDPVAFDTDLTERRGFEILETADGPGLSPHEREDPALHRVVARKL